MLLRSEDGTKAMAIVGTQQVIMNEDGSMDLDVSGLEVDLTPEEIDALNADEAGAATDRDHEVIDRLYTRVEMMVRDSQGGVA